MPTQKHFTSDVIVIADMLKGYETQLFAHVFKPSFFNDLIRLYAEVQYQKDFDVYKFCEIVNDELYPNFFDNYMGSNEREFIAKLRMKIAVSL